jgi:hypothetical protein
VTEATCGRARVGTGVTSARLVSARGSVAKTKWLRKGQRAAPSLDVNRPGAFPLLIDFRPNPTTK